MDEREEREKWMKEYQKDPGGTMWANLRLLQVQINELRAILEQAYPLAFLRREMLGITAMLMELREKLEKAKL